MNKKQKITILATTAANVIMCAIPPWVAPIRINSPLTKPSGYKFLLTPPTPMSSINLSMLTVQILAISMIGLGAYLYFKTPDR